MTSVDSFVASRSNDDVLLRCQVDCSLMDNRIEEPLTNRAEIHQNPSRELNLERSFTVPCLLLRHTDISS